MKLNNKQATLAGLRACGAVETFRSSKYRTFILDRATYMVGKSGALRAVRPETAPLHHSLSYTDKPRHSALRYVGRIAAVTPDLKAEQFTEIFKAVLRGEIEVDRNGQIVE